MLGLNWLDLTILCLLALGTLDGMKKGFIVSFINIAGIFIALFVSKMCMGFLSSFIINSTSIYTSLKSSFLNRINGLDKLSLDLLKLINIQGSTLSDSVTIVVINIGSFLIIFILANIVMNVFKNTLKKQVKKSALRHIDRLLGGGVGFVVAAIMVFIFFAVIVPFITVVGKNNTITIAINGSKLAKYFYYFNFIIPWLQQSNGSKDLLKTINEIRNIHP